MTKSATTKLQKHNDFEANHKAPLTAEQKRLIREMEKHLIKTNAPSPYNAGIMKCINTAKDSK